MREAAEAAAQLVEPGMRVGLGTGRTVARLLPALAERRLSGLRCVATSPETEQVATELGLPVEPFDQLDRLDIAIDGADQVAADWWTVKGGHGAHLREKIVAAAAERFVVIISEDKLVDALHAAGAAGAARVRGPGDAAGRWTARRCAPARRSRPRAGSWPTTPPPFGDPAALAAFLDAGPRRHRPWAVRTRHGPRRVRRAAAAGRWTRRRAAGRVAGSVGLTTKLTRAVGARCRGPAARAAPGQGREAVRRHRSQRGGGRGRA